MSESKVRYHVGVTDKATEVYVLDTHKPGVPLCRCYSYENARLIADTLERQSVETTAYNARGDHIKELMSVLGELWRWHERYENRAPQELAEKVTKALRVEKS
jgi:hypothetical protein